MWLQITSLVLSLTSLILTGVWYNKEPGPGCRVASGVLCCLLTAIFRVFLLSVIIAIHPFISVGVVFSILLISVIQQTCSGDGISSLPQSYYSLFTLIGHNLGHYDSKSNFIDKDKSKINHRKLLKRVRIFLVFHLLNSLLLLIPYYIFVEMSIQNPTDYPEPFNMFTNRFVTHSVPLVMVVFMVLSYILYHSQATEAVSVAKTWTETIASPPTSNRDSYLPTLNDEQPHSSPVTSRSPLRPQHSAYDTHSRPTSPSLSSSCVPISPNMSQRPCSMMYPYLPSAPNVAHNTSDIARETFPGGRKCEDDECVTCVWLKEGPNFVSSSTGHKYKFMTPATCTDTCLVYLVTCTKCK